MLDNNEQAALCDKQIRELDEAEKKSPDIEDLVVARQQAEQEIKDLDALISKVSTEQRKLEIYLKKQMQDYDKLTAENESSAIAIPILSERSEPSNQMLLVGRRKTYRQCGSQSDRSAPHATLV